MIFAADDVFTRTFVVTEALHEEFVRLFEDRNPLHVDDGYANAKGFRAKVMHGNILGGFLSYFIGECLPTRDVIIHSQEIEYKHPVYLNDVLNFQAKVEGVHESVRVVEFNFLFRKMGGWIVAKGKIQIGLLK